MVDFSQFGLKKVIVLLKKVHLTMYLLQRKNLSPRFRAHTYRHVVHTHCILPTNDQTESENRLMVEYPLALQIQKQHVVLAINDSKPPPGSHTLSLSLSQLFHIIINHAFTLLSFPPK